MLLLDHFRGTVGQEARQSSVVVLWLNVGQKVQETRESALDAPLLQSLVRYRIVHLYDVLELPLRGSERRGR